jgi:hypothetical protein
LTHNFEGLTKASHPQPWSPNEESDWEDDLEPKLFWSRTKKEMVPLEELDPEYDIIEDPPKNFSSNTDPLHSNPQLTDPHQFDSSSLGFNQDQSPNEIVVSQSTPTSNQYEQWVEKLHQLDDMRDKLLQQMKHLDDRAQKNQDEMMHQEIIRMKSQIPDFVAWIKDRPLETEAEEPSKDPYHKSNS